MNAQTCLITGSSGFIGSHLVARIAESNIKVVGLDLTPPRFSHPRFFHLPCDVSDKTAFHAAMTSEQPDWIVHLAAVHDLADPANERRGLVSYRSNIDSVQHLLEWLETHPAERRVIFTSSQLVNHVGIATLDPDQCQPDTYYGQSKLIGEKAVRRVPDPKFIWTIIRPTTIWGPGMSAHYVRFLEYVRTGRYLHPGKRPLWKSYGYVGNTAYQIHRLLAAPAQEVDRRVFYLADDQPLSLYDYARRLAFHLNAPPIRSIPGPLLQLGATLGTALTYVGWRTFPLTLFRMRNILTEYRVPTDELQRVVGPLPFTFEAGVQATAEWHLRSLKPTAA